MEALALKIKHLEEENAILRTERDRFRKAANDTEAEVVKRRVAYLNFESEYETERRRRVELELSLSADRDSSAESRRTSTPAAVGVKLEIHDDLMVPISFHDSRVKYGPPVRKRKGSLHSSAKVDPSSSSTSLDAPSSLRSPTKARRLIPVVEIVFQNLGSKYREIMKATTSSKSPTPQKVAIKDECKSEETWVLDPVQVTRYLHDTPHFAIKPPPLTVLVSRKALNEEYGLPIMGLLWKPEKKTHRFLLPTYEVNPQMPRSPGEPGILLSCRDELWRNGPWTLFVKVPGLKVVRMNYAGEYMCQPVGELTAEEFAAQSMSTKAAWGEKISTARRKNGPYSILRARMTVRKMLGHEPTEEQVIEESDRITKRGNRDLGSAGLTSEDVIAAFERGEERITIVKLVCVSYSHALAKEYSGAQTKCELRAKTKRKKETETETDATKPTKKPKREENNLSDNNNNNMDSSDLDQSRI